MSELIEQLAEDDSKVSWRIVTTSDHELDMLDNGSIRLKVGGKVIIVESMAAMLDTFAKAYQAAAPIDNVAEALEKAAKLCEENQVAISCKGGKNTLMPHFKEDESIHAGMTYADAIRKLIPDTQANRTEG
jgi:hypothetical protein